MQLAEQIKALAEKATASHYKGGWLELFYEECWVHRDLIIAALEAQAWRGRDPIGVRARLGVIAKGGTIRDAYHMATFSDPEGSFWRDVALPTPPESPAP